MIKHRHQCDLLVPLEDLLRIAFVDRLPGTKNSYWFLHHRVALELLRVLEAGEGIADRRAHRHVGDRGSASALRAAESRCIADRADACQQLRNVPAARAAVDAELSTRRRSSRRPSTSASARRSWHPAPTPDTATRAQALGRWRRPARRWRRARDPSAPRPCDPCCSRRRRADRARSGTGRRPPAGRRGPSASGRRGCAATRPR